MPRCDWLHLLPHRIYTRKEETCCLEIIYNFLLFPLLSRTTLLWGTNRGLVTIHYIICSILTASKNERVIEDGPIILRKATVSVISDLHGLLIQHKDQLPGIQISPK